MFESRGKIVTVVGARPQFIKAAVVSRRLRRTAMKEVLVHTGQHYDDNMSGAFFRDLDLPVPAHSLDIGSASHGRQTGRMLEEVERVLVAERPDLVLVYGDTNSTLAGALAAAKLHIPAAHVEAGLRSFNRRMPEEINRIVADHTCDILFTPTEAAERNLEREGIPAHKRHLVGDVMYDAVLDARGECTGRSEYPQPFLLVTIHRAENTDDPDRLAVIASAVRELARDCAVVFPMHPRTRHAIARAGVALDHVPGLQVTEPLGYHDMLAAESSAALVVTDSGGVQKEAFFAGVPCVTVRDETEWVELVELGWNTLAPPTSVADLVAVCRSIMRAARPPRPCDLYGGGRAGDRIVQLIGEVLEADVHLTVGGAT